eukprot:scaffold1616_cov395-Prasinococcus_capsulatus_cf.AAC.1
MPADRCGSGHTQNDRTQAHPPRSRPPRTHSVRLQSGGHRHDAQSQGGQLQAQEGAGVARRRVAVLAPALLAQGVLLWLHVLARRVVHGH